MILRRGLKLKICVSGAANMNHCGKGAQKVALALGREIAKQGCMLIEGATTGFPHWAAKGAKEMGGTVVGFSPAKTEKEHIGSYHLPLDYRDLVVYTGFGYSGRNLLLTRAADAVIVGCGRIGTINEFTIAFEDRKPIGVLRGAWETDELFQDIINKSHRVAGMRNKVIFDDSPSSLVRRLLRVVREEKRKNGLARKTRLLKVAKR